jgi:hypothetical protein
LRRLRGMGTQADNQPLSAPKLNVVFLDQARDPFDCLNILCLGLAACNLRNARRVRRDRYGTPPSVISAGLASRFGFLSGRSISSYEGTWVLSDQDSNAAPQTVQTASPVCGTRTSLPCVDTRRRNCIEQLSPSLGICASSACTNPPVTSTGTSRTLQ